MKAADFNNLTGFGGVGTAKKTRGMLNAVSLFSGCGGLDLGFAMSGHFSIKFACDIDTVAADTYAENFGARKVKVLPDRQESDPLFLLGDIQNLNFQRLLTLFPDTDVVIGGPPCQDFSVARGTDRANAGINTKRGRLYAYFVKVLISLQPKYFVFENVPGITSDNKGSTWDIIREDFSNLSMHTEDIEEIVGDGFPDISSGYFLAYEGVADASAVGVPQKRRRVVIVGVRRDLLKNCSAGSEDFLAQEISKICRSKIEGRDLLFRSYPLSSMEVFEGKTIDALEKRYRELMKEWHSGEENKRIPELVKWADEDSEALKNGIAKNYCRANSSEFSNFNFRRAMEEHRRVLELLGYKKIQVFDEREITDPSCAIPKESKKVVSRLYYTPPDENYKFLYRYKQWKVEGKNISMIYRRIHPLKPDYTITANGGGGTHGYHYER